jgi:hypothetical protein
MSAPYRQPGIEQVQRHRSLDPWKLALLFAWVCDLGRIGLGLLNRRPISGELGFAAVLATITIAVVVTWKSKGT